MYMSGAVAGGCPPGMEYIGMLDTVYVEQMVEALEVMTGIETANRYVIRNSAWQQFMFAYEVSSGMAKAFGGKDRPFTMVLMDNAQRQVCRIHRPQANPMFGGSRAMVEAPVGVNIGYIQQAGTGFIACDAGGQPFAQIVCPPGRRGTVPFPVISMQTGGPIGQIVKHYGGQWKERYTDADTFSLHFPIQLSGQMKVILLAAVFLIDFLYFEDTHNDRRNKGR